MTAVNQYYNTKELLLNLSREENLIQFHNNIQNHL